MSPSSLDALRTTWQHLSKRNNWALVTDVESFLRHATEEMNNLQDLRSPAQRMRVALMRSYSQLLYERIREGSTEAVEEVWQAGYRLALRDRFATDEAEVLAQETVALVLAKLSTLSSPTSFVFWMLRVYQTARQKTTKYSREILSLDQEGEDFHIHEPIEPTDSATDVEQRILREQLLEYIKQSVHNELEVIALVRCVLEGEKPHVVAYELGLLDYRIRVAKSRALQRLRKDPAFMRLLKELVGEPRASDAEGDSDDRQPLA